MEILESRSCAKIKKELVIEIFAHTLPVSFSDSTFPLYLYCYEKLTTLSYISFYLSVSKNGAYTKCINLQHFLFWAFKNFLNRNAGLTSTIIEFWNWFLKNFSLDKRPVPCNCRSDKIQIRQNMRKLEQKKQKKILHKRGIIEIFGL